MSLTPLQPLFLIHVIFTFVPIAVLQFDCLQMDKQMDKWLVIITGNKYSHFTVSRKVINTS
jgi:hypothetical protein